ncbi:hypothetical protein BJV74DRAFT_455642, partial [Russula compacta]
MSPIQVPARAYGARTWIAAAPGPGDYQSLYLGTFSRHGNSLEEENTMTRKRAESVAQYKLPIYQAAAVVSTVLAGVESQLLVFFKSSPDFTQQLSPVMLQYLLVLTYVALIFSV